jgi:hypothetical protein
MRQGEDDVEVVDGQDLLFAFCQPAFPGHVLALGAVAVAAGVIGRCAGCRRCRAHRAAPSCAVRQFSR